ncbi:MAG: hypothetical protein ACLRMZ_03220 [Blautia marasmi]
MEKMEPSTLFPCHTLLHCRHNPHIRMYFEEIISAFWSDGPEKLCRLSLLFNLLLCEIAELQAAAGDKGRLILWWKKSAARYSLTPRGFTLPGKWRKLILSVPAP